MNGAGMFSLVLVLAVGACAHGPATRAPDVLTLPRCADGLIGVRSEALDERSVPELGQTIESLGWIDSPGSYEIVVVDRAPELVNSREVARALADYYPADLRDRGIGGRVTFFVWFDPDGALVRRQISEGARYLAFDRAAAEVMSVMEFSPAATETCRVAFWGELVVTFEVRR